MTNDWMKQQDFNLGDLVFDSCSESLGVILDVYPSKLNVHWFAAGNEAWLVRPTLVRKSAFDKRNKINGLPTCSFIPF